MDSKLSSPPANNHVSQRQINYQSNTKITPVNNEAANINSNTVSTYSDCLSECSSYTGKYDTSNFDQSSVADYSSVQEVKLEADFNKSDDLNAKGQNLLANTKANKNNSSHMKNNTIRKGQVDKKERRLLRNRIAAKECRKKKKLYVEHLEQRAQYLEARNEQLNFEASELSAMLYLGELLMLKNRNAEQ